MDLETRVCFEHGEKRESLRPKKWPRGRRIQCAVGKHLAQFFRLHRKTICLRPQLHFPPRYHQAQRPLPAVTVHTTLTHDQPLTLPWLSCPSPVRPWSPTSTAVPDIPLLSPTLVFQ